MKNKKILFVCLGNICRSPSAEAIMKKIVEDEGMEREIFCDSAGTAGYHIGERADARMRGHAENRGYNLTSIGRQFDDENDFEQFDYIIGMDSQNIRDVQSLDVRDEYANKIYRMTDFCSSYRGEDVPDPYYGGDKGFHLVIDILEDACKGLLDKIKGGVVKS